MNQTPASRRFLPPSNSTQSRKQSSSTRSKQFAQQPQTNSSSPFARTPFQSRKASHQDEIETCFDTEDDQSPLHPPPRPQSNAFQFSRIDKIEDESVTRTTSQHSGLEINTGLGPSSYHEDTSIHNASEDDVRKPTVDFSSPLPKRQKTRHVKPPLADTAEASVQLAYNENDTNVDRTDSESDDVMEDNVDKVEDATTARTRFRIRPTFESDARDQGLRQPSSRAFKGMQVDENQWTAGPLPATFSPSKRRGKYDYIHGGAAETVRGWILDIANQQTRKGDANVREVRGKTSSVDNSGRFEVLTDVDGEDWMLVHQENQKALVLGDRTIESRERTIALNGDGTHWSIDIPDVTTEGRSNKLNIAVLWQPLENA